MKFDEHWETDIYIRGNHVNRYPFDHVVTTVFKYFGGHDRSQVDILELGCGTANNIAFLAQEGFRATGVDGSISAIEIGKKFLKSKNLEANLECFDFTNLGRFTDNSFDMVIDRGSITHNSRDAIVSTISEVRRVLKNGGVFLSHIFSDHHSGIKYGTSNGDGSYAGFSQGCLQQYKFVFFFASIQDTVEFYDSNFVVLTKIHVVHQNFSAKNDVQAMWYVTCLKPR